MQSNKDFIVEVEVVFRKNYIVNAKDWEYAEDYAVDEAHGDSYDIYSEDCIDIRVTDVNAV